jgi:hypothetical protein
VGGLAFDMLVSGSVLGSIINVHTKPEKLLPSKDKIGVWNCPLKIK